MGLLLEGGEGSLSQEISRDKGRKGKGVKKQMVTTFFKRKKKRTIVHSWENNNSCSPQSSSK